MGMGSLVWKRLKKALRMLGSVDDALATITVQLQLANERLGTIMSQQQDANAALQKINDATNKQGQALQAEADSLQKVSDNLDALVAKLGTTVPQDVLDGILSAADKAAAISDSLDQHAAFAAALASKGAADPVPNPVPAPTAAP